MDRENWQQVRELFDAVCELEPSQWRTELARLSANPAVIAETLELLQAQTCDLGRAREPMAQLFAASAPSELGEGDCIGPWRLCERLASGGMGIVFRAERADGLYAQEVAIKFLLGKPGARVAERLAAERRILASLQHPNIARLYDGGSTPGGHPYLVMEYVRGEPLDVYCARRQLDLRQRLQLFLKVCSAVQAAHARLVLHCDLKPSNILVREDGEPVLLDFGVSRLLDDTSSESAAQFFTPAYAAPELQSGQPAGVSSDVFSLAAVLSELLAGKGGRRGAGDAGVAVSAPSQVAQADCAWKRALRGDLDAIVVRAGALPPEQRYPSVEALAADVQRYLQHRPVQARRGGRGYRAGRWLRRNWKGAGLLLLVLLLAAWFVWRLAAERAAAEREAKIAEQVSGFLVEMFQAADPREKGVRGGEDISAREVLDRAAAQVDEQLDASAEVQARLKGVIGLAYRNTGDLRRANPMMLQAAEALAAAGGEKNLDEAARLFNLLAGSYANNRNGVEGANMARRALGLLGKQPADSFRVAQSYNSLGLSLLSEQRYDDAEAAFKQALQRHQAGKREKYIGVSLDNLGMMYRRKGDLAASAAAFDQSTPMFLRTLGEMSYDYWASNTERTLMLMDRGDLDEAIAAFEANLVRAPKIFGPRSIYVVSENNRLALALMRKGEYARAQPFVETAVSLSAQVLGKDSYNYSLVTETAAQLAQAQGDLAGAESAYRQALAIRSAAIGRDHPDSLDLELQLGLLLAAQGKDAGDALVQRAHAMWLPRIPASSANGIRLQQSWAEWLLAKQRLVAAGQALDAVEPLLGHGPYAAVRQQVLRARWAQARGNRGEAVQHWQRAVAAATPLYGEDSAVTAQWRSALQAAQSDAHAAGALP
ncbi:protein kinase domain-containing protein [Stenotrophomonas terrae]|uniref:serine/threonine-protein kinase n=1 Tax=Stenotrophomonas terrae TaxID=405446 RepID=UPI0007111B04|nr:serine/threonine-protein kinase [Stenotrophomonas terrae]